MVLSFGLIGLVHSPCCSFIGPSQHQSADFQVPLKFETFSFLRGRRRNRVTTNSCNRSHSSQEKKTLSIIYTSVPDTRLQRQKGAARGGQLCFVVLRRRSNKTSEQTKTCCETTSPYAARMKTWEILFRLTWHLVCWPLPCPTEGGRKVSSSHWHTGDLNGRAVFNETSHQQTNQRSRLLSEAFGQITPELLGR